MTIHKQIVAEELVAYGSHLLTLPEDITTLWTGLQSGNICVWYTTSGQCKDVVGIEIFVGWTGQDLPISPKEFSFLGILVGENLVHHVFAQRHDPGRKNFA